MRSRWRVTFLRQASLAYCWRALSLMDRLQESRSYPRTSRGGIESVDLRSAWGQPEGQGGHCLRVVEVCYAVPQMCLCGGI